MPRFLSVLLFSTMVFSSGPVTAKTVTSAISHEPFYADIVRRAHRLKARTDAFAVRPSPAVLQGKAFKVYREDIKALSALDLKGHLDLKARGTDSDLKCIMKGLSLDLGIKMVALDASKTPDEVKSHLSDMSQLLSDNIDVIVTPATADSGLDCVIEFGKS